MTIVGKMYSRTLYENIETNTWKDNGMKTAGKCRKRLEKGMTIVGKGYSRKLYKNR